MRHDQPPQYPQSEAYCPPCQVDGGWDRARAEPGRRVINRFWEPAPQPQHPLRRRSHPDRRYGTSRCGPGTRQCLGDDFDARIEDLPRNVRGNADERHHSPRGGQGVHLVYDAAIEMGAVNGYDEDSARAHLGARVYLAG